MVNPPKEQPKMSNTRYHIQTVLLSFFICGCSGWERDISIKKEKCPDKHLHSKVLVFVKENSCIDQIIYHSDTLSKNHDASIGLDFDLEVSKDDSLQLLINKQLVLIHHLDMNYPCMEIKAKSSAHVELHYFCKEFLFD